jgi:septal ring factor EnvC (AmiA/AmiB activator)
MWLPTLAAGAALFALGGSKTQLEKIKEDIRRHQADLRRMETEVSLSVESIHELDRRLEDIDKTMVELSSEMTETSGRMAAVQADLAEAEAELAARETELARLLVGADELGDFVRRLRFTLALAREDRRLARAARRKREEIGRDREALQREIDYLNALQDLKLEELRLARLRRERKQTILAQARGQRDVLKKRLRALKREKAELEKLVRSRSSGGRAVPDTPQGRTPDLLRRHGKIRSPTPGRLVRSFGRIKDDRYGTFTQNDGLDLEAPLGAEVKAVLKGKIVYADWFRGYGKLMIVDHGRGFTSLYAHLGEYAVRVGESVGEGETIGYVGDTGYVAKPTLHFELRQDGAAVNPEPWLRR